MFGVAAFCARADSPNVLVILTDDMGYGDIGCHGNSVVETPTIDRLFRDSLRLTQFYSQPVCTPTRAALMTGRYHFRTRAIDTLDGRAMMDPEEVTIAETFAKAGYKTGIFGKWHLGDSYPTRAIDQGFPESLLIRGGGLHQSADWPDNLYSDPILLRNGKAEKFKGYCTDIFVDATIEFIERNKDRPFFAYLATNVPHDPLEIPDEFVRPFQGLGLGEETPKIYGMMRNLDDNLARLFKTLDDLNLSENTIIIFSSDNGPAMALSEHDLRYNANLRGEKKQVYEGGIRVPCFMRFPGKLDAGREIDRISGMIDILPTLAEACGVPLPQNVEIDGKSLWPLLAGEDVNWPDRALYFQWHRGNAPVAYRNAAVRTQQYKLVDGKELYDLERDPREQHDISDEQPGVVEKLRQQYEAWFADVTGTRGFDPPLIKLGTPHENPLILSCNDWRRDPDSKQFLGHWKVFVSHAGNYRFTLLPFEEHQPPAEIHLRIRELERSESLKPGKTEYVFESLELSQGPAIVEAWVSEKDKPKKGTRMITVERVTDPS
jgi:arylsulfatase A-like enzyme